MKVKVSIEEGYGRTVLSIVDHDDAILEDLHDVEDMADFLVEDAVFEVSNNLIRSADGIREMMLRHQLSIIKFDHPSYRFVDKLLGRARFPQVRHLELFTISEFVAKRMVTAMKEGAFPNLEIVWLSKINEKNPVSIMMGGMQYLPRLHSIGCYLLNPTAATGVERLQLSDDLVNDDGVSLCIDRLSHNRAYSQLLRNIPSAVALNVSLSSLSKMSCIACLDALREAEFRCTYLTIESAYSEITDPSTQRAEVGHLVEKLQQLDLPDESIDLNQHYFPEEVRDAVLEQIQSDRSNGRAVFGV